MSRNPKKPRFNPTDPDKVGRGHKFGKVGRSATFRSKKDYRRKDKKNNKGHEGL